MLPRKLPYRNMVEVPRQSVFPPILQDYLPELKLQAKPSRPATHREATAGVNRLLEGREVQKPAKTGEARKARVKIRDAATANLQSVSENFKHEEEMEHRRKREKVLHCVFIAASLTSQTTFHFFLFL